MSHTVSYTAVVLDAESRNLLKKKFGFMSPDNWDWIAHHMTICMGAIEDGGIRSKIGSTVILNVDHIGFDEKVMAVKAVGFYCKNKIPHITLSVDRMNGRKPYMSNNISIWKPIDSPFIVRGVVTEILNSNPMNESITDIKSLPFLTDIKAAGGEVYQVGGAVRDAFLGKTSKDLDIVVRGVSTDILSNILEKYGKVIPQMVGGTFGMIKFTPNDGKEEIDIAIPRTERSVGPGYQGFEINADHNLPIEKDLERRDFTINSIAKDLNDVIVDPYGGQNDLKAKVIRVTNPIAFSDDPLRMLRAIQFTSRFEGFSIEPATFKLIKDNAPKIKEISAERILIELDKIVKKGDPLIGLKLLVDTDLFENIFDIKYAGNYENLRKVKTMGEFIFCMFINTNLNITNIYLKTLKGDNDTAQEIRAYETLTLTDNEFAKRKMLYNVNKISPAALNSFIVKEMYDLGDTLDTMIEDNIPLSRKDLAISGYELIEMGMSGIEVGKSIQLAIDSIYQNKIPNTKDAIFMMIDQPLKEAIQKIKNRF